jgi:hypothetical protein
MLGENILLQANREVGLEVNIEKTKVSFIFCPQSAERNHNFLTANKSFENVAKLYLGTTATNQNFIREESERGLNMENACYRSVQKLLSCLLSKYLKIKIYRAIILPVFVWVWTSVSHAMGRYRHRRENNIRKGLRELA